MRLSEIQRTASDDDQYDFSHHTLPSREIKNLKRLPGSTRYGYVFGPYNTPFTGATKAIFMYDLRSRKPRLVGHLDLRPTGFPLPRSYAVANVVLDDAYRGVGLGQSLYGIALKLLGLTVVADDTQTAESRKMWMTISRVPGVSVKGYTSVGVKDWDLRDRTSEIVDMDDLRTIRLLKRAGGQEIGRDNIWAYVNFPVVPDPARGELVPTVPGIPLYSKTHPEFGGTDNGLYAQWTGG